MVAMLPHQNSKEVLWNDFLTTNNVLEESVPLFDTEVGFVKTMGYGRNQRPVFVRSPKMESLMRKLGQQLVKEHSDESVSHNGILYMMFRKTNDGIAPLYIGKAEIYGKGDKNLSANIYDLVGGNGKFGRWGYNYAYHFGDLSAVALDGHPENKKTRKYMDWRDSLFKEIDGRWRLQGDIRFWACNWGPECKSIWRDYGKTRLAFEEYLLIGVASDLFPNDLLNREGRNR